MCFISDLFINFIKVEISVNGEVCDPLSFVSHSSKAVSAGRNMTVKLKEVLSRQQFEIILQAKIGQKVFRLLPSKQPDLNS